MFKTKKGFTLIELLATIVILGLLALIVTPGIAKVIRNSKINTAKASLEGYVREIENASTLYLTDTGDYPNSIDVLEIDGKNISKIKNPIVELSNGGVVKVTAKIDGLYCIYEKGIDTICQEESFYSYIKNSNNMVEITSEIENKYGISMGCLNSNICTDEEQESMTINQDKINELGSKIDMTYYGFNRENVRGIEFTNIKPNGVGIDVSLNNTNDVLLYYTVTKEEEIEYSLNDNSNIMFLSDVETIDVYDIKIYSEKEIMFPEESSFMFLGITKLNKLILNNINTSNVKNMAGMFRGTGSLSRVFTLDLGDKFDTSKVTDMSGMFSETGRSSEVFTLDLGDKFDTRNVTDMSMMFNGTGRSSEVFTLDLGNKFDTRKVTDMSYMFNSTGFSNPNFTLDLSTFDTSNVTDMSNMFNFTGRSNPNFTLDLSGFDTSKVEYMSYMFSGASNLKTIYVSDKWTTNSVTESTNMFYNCTSLPNFNSSVYDKTNAHYGTGGYLTLKQ